MRVILRRLNDGRFLNRAGFWTQSSADARDFGDSNTATEAAAKLTSEALELVLADSNGRVVSGFKLRSSS